jgi:subtilisin family serine protease
MKRSVRPFPRRFCFILIVLLLLVTLSAFPAAASDPESEIGPYPYAPGEVLIGWQPASGEVSRGMQPKGFSKDRVGADWQPAAQALEALTGLTVLDVAPYHGFARLAVPTGQEQAEIARLSALPWVDYAEPNYIAYAADTTPNDPYFSWQWNMQRVKAPAAWDLTMGSDSIVVAVVDSGIDLNHPEFAGRILEGYDYVRGDSEPNDEFDHGTHVSGIIAAAANNAIGVAGLAARVKILPLKVLDNTGTGYISDIALAILDAADYGAPIINLSLQSLVSTNTLYNAVVYAKDKGCLAVAAAGNYGNNGNPVVYPGAYSEVFTVGASDYDDNWASYSGYNDHVDLAAPGGTSASQTSQIWSTVRVSKGSYGYMYGTSMATPMVSAAAALVWTCVPTATRQEVTNILKQTADKVGTYGYDENGRNPYFGYGRLNVGSAVPLPSLSTSPGGTQYFLLGGTVQQASDQMSLINSSRCRATWQASVLQGADWLTLSAGSSSGTATSGAPGALSFDVNSTTLSPGQYTGLIRVQYNNGTSSVDIPVQLQVVNTLHRVFVPQTMRQ